jgi:hypothetical protein
MGEPVLQRSFGSGEIAPGLAARADLDAYASGARTVRNFLVRRHGGLYNRPGSLYVATAKDSGSAKYLFPFIFPAADQSFLIEAGNLYFRFHHNGAPVTVSGVTAWSNATAYVVGDLASRLGVNYYCILAHTNQQPPNATYWYAMPGDIYEVPTPYVAGRFAAPAPLCWSQAGSVVTLTHLNEPPLELVYGGDATSWVLRAIATAPTIGTPQSPSGVEGAAGARTFRYVITAVDAVTYEESLPSSVIELTTAAEPTVDAPHALAWSAVTGAAEYRVYKDPFENDTFGFIGTATAQVTFNDPGAIPDFADTPPKARVLFASTNNYPAASIVHGQRRIFGGTHTDREDVFASQVGLQSNFSIRSPLQDDDAVSWNLASNRIQPILHLRSMKHGLVQLTDSGIWLVRGDEQTGIITPSAINLQQHGYIGSSFTPPVEIGNTLIYVQGRGTVLRDVRFDRELDSLGGRDLTLLAGHLFRRKTIVDMDFQLVPDSIVWCVRSDGALLGLTYLEELDTWGWHRHDTFGDAGQGLYKQVVVLPEGDEDVVYLLVEREVAGDTVTFIERLAPRDVEDVEDYHFVDAGVEYAGAATTTIDGLDHLVGETVVVFADGAPVLDAAGDVEEFTVDGDGEITLTTAVTSAHVGLAITSDLQTLDLDINGSSARDKAKRINQLSLICEEGSFPGFQAGPSSDRLKRVRKEVWDTTTTIDGRIEARIEAAYTHQGRVFIRHVAPAPLAILGLIPRVEVGG